MPGATQPTILLVENDEDTRCIYTEVLSQTGAYLLEAGNPYEGFNALRSHSVSLILTDLHMPGGGLEYLATLRRETGTCPIIVITGLVGFSIDKLFKWAEVRLIPWQPAFKT